MISLALEDPEITAMVLMMFAGIIAPARRVR